MYRVSTEDKFGIRVTQQDGFHTHKEAQKEADECINLWGKEYNQNFWVEEYKQKQPKEKRVYAYPNSIDGWEDIYPQEDY
tara:strand:+ start:204 stop:443 length:240 start_codon:yes stop_codon:yes gene_type:complete